MINIASTGVYNASNGAATAPIPKPTGLAVGDLMVAVISTVRSAITSAPAGWTIVNSNNLTYNFCTVYKKIADASDVSASTFSWSGSYSIGGIIYRIPEGDFNNIQMSLTAPLTPKTKDNAVILVGTSSDNDSDSCTFSGYSTTGGVTVTYTEGYDSYGTPSSYYAGMGVASGIYSSFDNITAFNVTADASPDQTSRFMVLIGDIYTLNHSDIFKNCLAYYKFEGNSNDSSINLINGTDTDITYSDVGGKQGKYASFNGTSSRINLGTSLSLQKDFTISFWIKTLDTDGQIIIKDLGNSTWPQFSLIITSGYAHMRVFSSNNATPTAYVQSTTPVNDNKWHHVVFTRDGTNINIYVDGKLEGQTAWTNAQWASPEQIIIGGHQLLGGTFNNLLGGILDEIGIWNRALSLDEVRLLYVLPKSLHNGLVTYYKFDANSYDFIGKADGADSNITYSAGKINNGALFNGTSSKIVTNKQAIPLGAKSVSFWFKSSYKTTYQTIFGNCNWERNDYGFSSWIDTGGKITFTFRTNNGGGDTITWDIVSPIDICDNNLHHIVFTWDGTTNSNMVKMYIDGALRSQLTSTKQETDTPTYNLFFGSVTNDAYWLNALLDEFAIWNRALTKEEIQQLFYAGNANQYPLQTNMADFM